MTDSLNSLRVKQILKENVIRIGTKKKKKLSKEQANNWIDALGNEYLETNINPIFLFCLNNPNYGFVSVNINIYYDFTIKFENGEDEINIYIGG